MIIKLLLFLILTFSFQNLAKADDIRDFQIEGMNLGNSLLDHYSEKIIKKRIKLTKQAFPSSDKFFRTYFKSKSKEYDFIGIHLKKNDFQYIIYSISGQKNMTFSKCKKKSESIENELKDILGENYKSKAREVKHTHDKTGKSINLEIYFTPIDNDDFWPALITCTNWSKKYEKKNFFDNLSVSLNSEDFSNFMFYEAYK